MSAYLLRSLCICCMLLFLSSSIYAEETSGEGGAAEGEGDSGSLDIETEKRVHLVPESLEQTALADESVKKQIVWLDSSEAGQDGVTSFLALELYENAAASQGAVLFLHGAEQHPNWPQVIKPLRTILTDDGWYTLSIMLPYERDQPAPSRDLQAKQSESVAASDTAPRFSGRYSRPESVGGTDGKEGGDQETSDETSEDTDNDAVEEEPTETAADLELKDSGEELIDISADEKAAIPADIPFEEKVQMRLKAGLDYIAEKDYQNVVLVGYRQGAQGVLDYLASNKGFLPEQGLTIIWVDAVLTEEQSSSFGKLLGQTFSLNMLDVIDSSSRPGVLDGKIRSGQARRNRYAGYSLVKLPITDVGRMEVSTLTQRVRGWLKVNAPGMQTGDAN